MMKSFASVGLLCVIQTHAGCGLDGASCPGGTWLEQSRRRRRNPPAACGCHKGGATDWCGHADLCDSKHSIYDDKIHYAYDLPELCTWGQQPNKVEGEWIAWDFLSPYASIVITTASESTLTKEQTQTVGQTVTHSMSHGMGVDVKGISASAKAENSVVDNWSSSYRTEFTTKQSDETKVTVTSADAQRAKQDQESFLWTWQFTTTYNWNAMQVITQTNTKAYTKNAGAPPKCVALGGEDESYQSCIPGAWLPGYGPQSGNATVI